MNKILYLSTLLVTIIFYGCATSGPGINNIKAELPNSPIAVKLKRIKYWKKIRQFSNQ